MFQTSAEDHGSADRASLPVHRCGPSGEGIAIFPLTKKRPSIRESFDSVPYEDSSFVLHLTWRRSGRQGSSLFVALVIDEVDLVSQ